ncbi:hypothetical protein NIES3806_21000 [Microcystis aeruginosa NIES-3806]|uniref:PEP-CTERM sorting domain-containing protein n=1 Tax=Microcystis aeruginosa TaxID=1126 RepID=UPI00082020FB|nr:PEP-CTERM sorting domain-containing protein [Microcystis aeruginosa]AOC52770.1 hypothetical protein amyaer_2051 [Microcystis aeruginosa NIES-2481]GCL54757.1 hypothetical protein NIES3806_21000 [Microcystis aeruginosa NIES-3806]
MMTTNKLTKTFASGSLAIGIATLSSVAGSLLVAPSAQAAFFGTIGELKDFLAVNDEVIVGDKAFYDFDFDGLSNNIEIDIFAAGGTWVLELDAGPAGGVTTGSLSYRVHITDPNFFFDTVTLDTDVVNPFTATKLIEYDGGSTLLTSVNGNQESVDLTTFDPNIDTLRITDTFLGGGGTLLSLSNQFTQDTHTVPEPGTILGLLAVGGLGLVSRFKKQK